MVGDSFEDLVRTFVALCLYTDIYCDYMSDLEGKKPSQKVSDPRTDFLSVHRQEYLSPNGRSSFVKDFECHKESVI